MARRNNEIPVNKGIVKTMAKKVKEAIGFITEKDSLSDGDTKAIRVLTDVYDILLNPVKENPVFYHRGVATDCNNTLIGEVVEIKKEYVNETDCLVEVSFQIPYHDWKILRKSIQWLQVEKRLEEIRNKHIQRSLQVQKD